MERQNIKKWIDAARKHIAVSVDIPELEKVKVGLLQNQDYLEKVGARTGKQRPELKFVALALAEVNGKIALEKAREAQSIFWTAKSALEDALGGVEIADDIDLRDYELDALKNEME